MAINNSKIFLLAGRTGGPFLPLPWYSQNLDLKPIYIGVKNSFEEKYCQDNSLSIEFLPEVKLSIVSFKKQKPSELLKNLLELAGVAFKLLFSVLKSII